MTESTQKSGQRWRAAGKTVLTNFFLNIRRNGVCRDRRNFCWSVSCDFLVSNFEYYCRKPRTTRFYATYWWSLPTFGVNGRQYVCCLRITIQTDRPTDRQIALYVCLLFIWVRNFVLYYGNDTDWRCRRTGRWVTYLSLEEGCNRRIDKTTHWETLWFVLLT
jgi:hypothetical protein